ncbi:hypothetical protein NE619_09560 [Anaerovorax odorimutans]|uniref:Alternate signal-mediated exported protein, CPF_0494 family n=1 Tax=Anaerovorax odorimutans TaxID=109327 RepID=A0ABT1RP65_9FIRM|nr:hypothetical protein [Anaerovorax odorimutans]MCQ4636977.1 hypothetical protein [Anaerovorax odorimutans]
MDKLSAVMIGAICALLCISGAVVYGTWFSEEDEATYASSLAQVEEEMALAAIAMNDEAQVINGGGRDMWVRAKVDSPETEHANRNLNGGRESYRLISDTIAVNPSEAELKSGVWTREEDGYYYYSLPVSPGEQSKSLFTSVVGPAESEETGAASIKVYAEAVQVNWIRKKARDAKEAFQLFRAYQPLQEYKGKFV